MKTAPITVKYLDHLGSDLEVVNAARVSFDKESDWEIDWNTGCNCFAKSEIECSCESFYPDKALSEKDAKLIDYLAKHKHWSPFSHCYLKFRIKAPIFVARQLQKHTVGLAWNEVSRRYVDSEPEFYFPDTWRAKAENVKQGSSHTPVQLDDNDPLYIEQTITANLNLYNYLLDMGTCAEQARTVLPQNTITEWIWSGSLAAFARVVKLRTDPHSQYETSLVAHGIKYSLVNHFPYSTEALLK
jgi:thymidylate synthase (FAD)